jgi:peptide/nickel transport system substrate-binding protein
MSSISTAAIDRMSVVEPARWTRRTLLLGAGASALAACGRVRSGRDTNTLVVGLTYDIDTLNVYSTGFLGDVQAAVVEGLLAPDQHARYVPVLATEVPTLENGGIVLDGAGMTITYKLRPGVLWHDGQPFTSADVAFTWRAVKDPAFIAESKDGTEEIVAIKTPDALTVICRYATVSPTFATTLFTFGILPRHLLEGVDLNTSSYGDRPIGTGPFMVTAFKRGQYVLTERFPGYWRRDAGGRRLPYLDKLIFKIIPNSNTLLTQIRSGELDLVTQTPYDQAKQMHGLPGVELLRAPLLSWQHLDFNYRNPLLADRQVRLAIAHAINREPLVRAQGGFPAPIKSPVVPVFDFYDAGATEIAYDPAKARALLKAAGHTGKLRFRFLAQAGKGNDELAQQVIIAQLKAVGIDAYADNKTGVSYRQARYTGEYDINYATWVTGADPIYSRFYATKGSNNGQGYSNPVLDRVLARMEGTLDPTERRRAAFAMQRILLHDLPSVPLTSNVAVVTKRSTLAGFTPNPTNMTPFVGCAFWRWQA